LELFTTLGWTYRTIEVCLDYLRHVGIEWSAHPTKKEVQQEYESLWNQIGSRSVEDLVDLPLMIDPKRRATMDVLTAVASTALFTDENLPCLPLERKGEGVPVRSLRVLSHVPSQPQTAAKVRGFSPIASGFTAETDWLLEGEGFEPSVPRQRTLFETAPFELAFPTGRERDRGFDPAGREARCRSATASPATSKRLAPRCVRA
jgi:hypothetical protein